jgi:hypothetical protein
VGSEKWEIGSEKMRIAHCWVTSHFLLLTCPLNLEGKKAHLEGTWRAVGGHLEGRAETLQTLINSRVAGQKISTWRVFGKSIYKNCGKSVNRMCTS